MRYLQGQLTLALNTYTTSGSGGGSGNAAEGGGGLGSSGDVSGVSLCDSVISSTPPSNVNATIYPTSPSTSSSSSSTSSTDQARRTILNRLFGSYLGAGGSPTPTTPTSPGPAGSTETWASVIGAADTETKARHRVVFMFPSRLKANITENTLFFSGSNFSLADMWCSRIVSTGEPNRLNNYNSNNYNNTLFTSISTLGGGVSTTPTPTNTSVPFGSSPVSTNARASSGPSPCLVASLTSLECAVGTRGVPPGGYTVEVLWQCTQVAASYPLTITAATTTTTPVVSSTSTTSTTTSTTTTTSFGGINNVPVTSTSLSLTPSLPQFEGLHPHQGPISGGTVVSVTGTGLETITACRFTRTSLDLALVSDAVVVPAVTGGGAEVGVGGRRVVQCVTPAVDVDGTPLALSPYTFPVHIPPRPHLYLLLSLSLCFNIPDFTHFCALSFSQYPPPP